MQETSYLQGREDLVETFRRLPFLGSLDERYLKDILALSKLRKYRSGETITPEGSYDCWIYVIISGAVRIVKEGREIARLDRIGDTFGELAVIDGKARSASVDAAEDSVCLAVDASFLDRLPAEEQPAFYSVFYRLFAEILAHRLRATSEELARVKDELERLKGD